MGYKSVMDNVGNLVHINLLIITLFILGLLKVGA